MTVIAPLLRTRHAATILAVFQSVEAVQERPDRYTFPLPGDEFTLTRAMAFVVNERLCCPLFGFAVEVQPEGGAVWLASTGREAG